jgi:hypothetical protein
MGPPINNDSGTGSDGGSGNAHRARSGNPDDPNRDPSIGGPTDLEQAIRNILNEDANAANDAYDNNKDCKEFIDGLIRAILDGSNRAGYFARFQRRFDRILNTLTTPSRWGGHVQFTSQQRCTITRRDGTTASGIACTGSQWPGGSRSGLSNVWVMTFSASYFAADDDWRAGTLLHEVLHALGQGFDYKQHSC